VRNLQEGQHARCCQIEGTAKATLAGLMGSQDGLNSERRYARTLAQSIIRYMVAGNLGQAFAICIGLAVTTGAYGRVRLAHAAGRVSIRHRLIDLAETRGAYAGL